MPINEASSPVSRSSQSALSQQPYESHSPMSHSSPMSQQARATRRVFMYGSALKGQIHHSDMGRARFIRAAKTCPFYRLYAVHGNWYPVLCRGFGDGMSILGEVYELTQQEFSDLLVTAPPNTAARDLVLSDGEVLTALLYPRELADYHNWPDISVYGSWTAYRALATAH